MANLNSTADTMAGETARPPFNHQEFAAEQFLSGFQADVQSLNWCIKTALVEYAGIDCWETPFSFGDYDVDSAQRWGWTIVDLHSADGRSADFVVSATECDGIRLYTFETDDGLLEDISLSDNAEKVFNSLMQGLLPKFC
jgi:hypothetical protein